MKLSATVKSAAVAAAMLVSATAANAAALITETYDGSFDAAFLHITNTGPTAFTNLTVSGGYAGGFTNFGSVAAGATVNFYLGDNEYDFPGSQGTALVTVLQGGHTFSGSFTDVIGDPDFSVGPVTLGTLTTVASVPEPTSWAMLLTGFGLLGFAMRWSRRKAIAA